jgi:hypothetical protein
VTAHAGAPPAEWAKIVTVVTEEDVRRAALGLPETTEKPSYGTPGFRVKDKLFARIREEGDVLAVWCEDVGEKEALIASEPEKFFTTPHYDGTPMVLVRFGAVEVEELTELLTESWRIRAPKRVRAAFDAER